MEYTGDAFHTFLDLDSRDAPNAIFLADSDFFGKCDLPITILSDSGFLSKNYN